ncbi:MAG TPA: UDP-glucose 4-epimerase GalE [Dongiaceae bacterium]|nr:UDP-glucose 4-epimerase GalE [Dongiaceae bacterium]
MKILVTGGAGYVGSHACKAIAEAGHQPIVYDNLSRGHRSLVRWGAFEQGDLADRARLRDVITRHRPDGILHFAAFAYVGESVERPALYYENNVLGSLSLLEAIRESGPDIIVFSSTCATYGVPTRLPIDEDHPQNPVNPYGVSKLIVERMLRDYGAAYGLRSVSLRYFNAAGADPGGEIGEMHEPETHAIPLAVLAALGRMPAFQVYGKDYPTADGSAVRDYIHVADLASAHVRAFEYLSNGGESTAINLGTGLGTSVLELIGAVERVAGRPVPIVHRSRRPGDPHALIADARRASAVLGWRPNYVDIREIVATAWRWHSSR